MAKVYDNSYESITQRVIDFTYNLWKAGVWGVDLGVANRLKVNTDGEIDVNVITGGGATASALTPIAGALSAVNLTSEHGWAMLIDNTSAASGKILWLQNHCDKSLEIAYNDSPNHSAGVDIDDYIGPWTAREIPLKSNEGLFATDVYVRQYDSTPTLGSVFGTLYY